MDRKDLLSYLNEYLDIEQYQDYCKNGLQVHGTKTINKIVSGVTFSRRLIQEAIQQKAELILVHHGLFKGDIPDPPCIYGTMRDRLALLLLHNLNLVAYHLPLDAHPEVGNNALALKKLGLNDLQPLDVGFMGTLPKEESLDTLIEKIQILYGREILVFPFGPSSVKKIGLISGGSSSLWESAYAAGVDLFICGDMKESIVRKIEETGLNVMVAGHYHTETIGIKALSHHIQEKFSINKQKEGSGLLL